MIDYFEEIDRQIVLYINGLHTPFLDEVMWWVSAKITWIPLYVILIYLAFKKLSKETQFRVKITEKERSTRISNLFCSKPENKIAVPKKPKNSRFPKINFFIVAPYRSAFTQIFISWFKRSYIGPNPAAR